jgi:parvulin-like peptidyl-prolyl isomerase
MALVINGEEVGDRVVEEEFDAIKQHHTSLGEVVCCDRDEEFRQRAIDHVVNRTLLRQECLRLLGENPETEIAQAIADLKTQHGSEEDFYRNTGYTPEQDNQIRQRVGETLSVTRILDHHLGPDPEPDEAELRSFLEDNREDYLTPEEVRTWHIFLEPHSPEDGLRYYEILRQARRELLAGADFEQKAKEICRPDHLLDLGFYRQGSMVREVEIVTFSMDVGEISPVISTHFGIHLFKVIDRKDPAPIPFEEVRDELAKRYPQVWRDTRVQELLARLKSTATIITPALETASHG